MPVFTSTNERTGYQDDPGATVNITPIDVDDDEGLYNIDDEYGVWSDYCVINRYENDKHIYMVPLTSPGGFQGSAAGFVQLASATMLLISDWTGERAGSPPTTPNPTPADPNMILLDVHVETPMKMVMGDGDTIMYRVHGTYVYGFKNADTAAFSFPTPPWLPVGTGSDVTDASSYQDGILFNVTTTGSSTSQNTPTNPSQAGQ